MCVEFSEWSEACISEKKLWGFVESVLCPLCSKTFSVKARARGAPVAFASGSKTTLHPHFAPTRAHVQYKPLGRTFRHPHPSILVLMRTLLPNPRAAIGLATFGATAGPLVDAVHNQALLTYDVLPIAFPLKP